MAVYVFGEQVQSRRRTSYPLLIAAFAIACATALLAPALAGSYTFTPPKHRVWMGVSDTGQLADFQSFAKRVGKHPAILETFHRWGVDPGGKADARWEAARARPMLHISTTDSYGGDGIITPHNIAKGVGDDYLILLNRYFSSSHRIAYIRPFGEMNGSHNPYSAFNSGGSHRDRWHSTSNFRRAWRRIVIIVRGGGSLAAINAKLKRQHLTSVKHDKEPLPSTFPRTPVSFVWSPQCVSVPNRRGNQPANYYPGGAYIDWVATDFYSSMPNWRCLNRFYKRWRRKPFALTEWGVTGRDSPKFVRQMIGWVRRHGRTRMIVYYRGFGNDRYDLRHYPRASRALRGRLKSSRFPGYTPENQATSGGVSP